MKHTMPVNRFIAFGRICAAVLVVFVMSCAGVLAQDTATALIADGDTLVRKDRVSDPLPWMPYLAAGWNPRPWTYLKAPSHYHRFFEFSTRSEFSEELRSMKEDLIKHRSLGLPRKDGTHQKVFTIYAWNEFGEGGMVAPTKGRDTMMLECIKDVFGANVTAAKTVGKKDP